MKDKRLIANFSSLLVSNFTVQGIRFFIVILLSRKLGPDLFGIYNYLLLLVSLCAIVVEFGLKNYAIREFSLGEGSWTLVAKIFRIRSFVSIASCLCVGALAYQAFRNPNLVVVSMIFGFSLIIDAFLIDFAAISQEKLHLQALGQVFQSLVFLILVYFILDKSSDLKLIGIAFAISHLFLVATYYLGIDPIPQTKTSNSKSKLIIIGGLPFLLANIAATFQSQMDIFLLGQFHFSEVLGDYSACLKLLSIPLGIVGSLMSSLQPRLARNSENKSVLCDLLKKYSKLLVLFVLVMNVVIFIFDKELIRLFFGDKYVSAHFYLFPLSLVTSVFILTLLPMTALFVGKKTNKLLKITFLNFGLSLGVISLVLHFEGPLLLPWAMLFVQVICLAQAWRAHLT